ncbi:MAG TPA: hypothetical protein VK530_13995 [Candidatus Acidoferrum sp.]|nr:hypothetical protein [Candidatus Acidoferrum sp.]
MRIHIQDCRTQKFLREPNNWVAVAAAARNFPTSMDAFRHCIDLGLAGVSIFVDRGGHRRPLVIPVDKEVASPLPASHSPVAWD